MQHENSAAKAERIISEELARLGCSDNELVQRRKTDPAKLALAARLRQETTLWIKEVAARLSPGKAKGANTNLREWMNRTNPADTAQGTLSI